MSFDSRIIAFADRFLSTRTFELIVAPALADHEFESQLGRRNRLASRCAVLRAVTGGLRVDLARDSLILIKLTLLSACYYTVPLVMGFEYFKTWSQVLITLALVLVLSMVPVLVCFWPERRTARPVD